WLLLMQMHPFCVVGQLHASKPFIGWVQTELLKSLNCIWFNREEQKDREKATQRIEAHIKDPNKPRLLIFPEGTCVNNEYVIQFKRGTFALNAEICPIAIKYKFCEQKKKKKKKTDCAKLNARNLKKIKIEYI
ncbi:hypothetical protein RFI_26784, partial [Reticulomyxa filosa]